ncbi:MAG TPA: hypothetical protein VLI92_01915 [Candidatus Saccharimonadales bacterium]|nr:hypothetical protein [Candidatus Saccharimonadales bacterium]
MNYSNFPGIEGLAPRHRLLLERLLPSIGADTLKVVWNECWIPGGLILQDHGSWVFWGNKDEKTGETKGPVPHSLVTAAFHLTLGRLLGNNVRTMILTGATHDSSKAMDIQTGNYEQSHNWQRELLTRLFGQRIAFLAEMSGHAAIPTVLANIQDPDVRVAAYADGCVMHTDLVLVADRMAYLIEKAKDIVSLDGTTKPGLYPYNKDGIALYGVTFFEEQLAMVRILETGLSLQLGVKPTSNLPLFIKALIEEDFGLML